MNLNQVTVPSKNVKKSIAFYEILGLNLIVEALPHYARFECLDGNATFSIHLADTISESDGVTVYFEEEDLDNYVKELVEKGIVFDEMPEDMIEVERKFLVLSDAYKHEAYKKTEILQGFLNSDKERTVRVRIKGNKGYLTVKGISSKDGTSRFEWEKTISKNDAKVLLKLCELNIISKMRYEVRVGNHVFEVDEFYEDNKGLVIAEIELKDPEEVFKTPEWLGEEVTGQIAYYNSQLSKTPFKLWKL